MKKRQARTPSRSRSLPSTLKQARLDGAVLTESVDLLYFDLLPSSLRFMLAEFCIACPLRSAYGDIMSLKHEYFECWRLMLCARTLIDVGIMEFRLRHIIAGYSAGVVSNNDMSRLMNDVASFTERAWDIVRASTITEVLSPYSFGIIGPYPLSDMYYSVFRIRNMRERISLEKNAQLIRDQIRDLFM